MGGGGGGGGLGGSDTWMKIEIYSSRKHPGNARFPKSEKVQVSPSERSILDSDILASEDIQSSFQLHKILQEECPGPVLPGPSS